jgi:hypothetical protein
LRQRHICTRDQHCNDRYDGAQRQLLPGLQSLLLSLLVSLLVNVQSPLSVPTGSSHLVCTVRLRSMLAPMDAERLRRQLSEADEHVAQGVRHVAEQWNLIMRLERQGRDTAAARALLARRIFAIRLAPNGPPSCHISNLGRPGRTLRRQVDATKQSSRPKRSRTA